MRKVWSLNYGLEMPPRRQEPNLQEGADAAGVAGARTANKLRLSGTKSFDTRARVSVCVCVFLFFFSYRLIY